MFSSIYIIFYRPLTGNFFFLCCSTQYLFFSIIFPFVPFLTEAASTRQIAWLLAVLFLFLRDQTLVWGDFNEGRNKSTHVKPLSQVETNWNSAYIQWL